MRTRTEPVLFNELTGHGDGAALSNNARRGGHSVRDVGLASLRRAYDDVRGWGGRSCYGESASLIEEDEVDLVLEFKDAQLARLCTDTNKKIREKKEQRKTTEVVSF